MWYTRVSIVVHGRHYLVFSSLHRERRVTFGGGGGAGKRKKCKYFVANSF